MKRLLAFLTISIFALGSVEAAAKARSKKKKKKTEEQVTAEPNTEDDSAEPETDGEARDGMLFPDWGAPGFGVGLSPFGGQAVGKSFSGDADIWALEIGLRGKVQGIPLYTGVPGFYLAAHAGYSLGWQRYDYKDEDDASDRYNGWWIGSSLTWIYHQFKDEIEVIYGKRDWKDEDDLMSIEVKNTFSVLIFHHFSGNYLLSYARLYSPDFANPITSEVDNWLYAALDFDLFDTNLSVGPGIRFVGLDPQDSTGSLTYFKIRAGMNFFSLIEATLFGNYIISDNIFESSNTGADAIFRRPTQPLNSVDGFGLLPEDTFDLNGFVGAKIFGGIGVGLNYNYRVANLFESNGDREVSSTYGYGLSYNTTL